MAFAGSAWGFSMQGPLGSWQTPRIGYDFPLVPSPIFGGPMSINEEYRLNVPTVYYAFTPEFVQYYGARGVAEIEKAFSLLNTIPNASSIDLDSYPLQSARANYAAAALGLMDVRSTALSALVEMMGLADPTLNVYTLRGREPISDPPITNYYIIRRNYDPVTWKASPYINGLLWTYTFVGDVDDTHSLVFNEPVDPIASLSANLPVSSGTFNLLSGMYWTTLTRDDMGGIRYIYRKDNYNVETLPNSATFVTGGTWGAPGGTNGLGTNLLVNTSIRPGVGRVRFQRAHFDSLFGFFLPVTNRWEDTYITNGTLRTQYIERALQAPDILIHAGDLGGDETASGTIIGVQYDTVNWIYGNTNSGGTNITGGGITLGPGTVALADGAAPSFTLTFPTINEFWLNTYPLDGMDEVSALHFYGWGSFDGTTNEPVIYPVGVEVRDIERFVLQGRVGDPWGAPPASAITTNNTAIGGGGTTPTP